MEIMKYFDKKIIKVETRTHFKNGANPKSQMNWVIYFLKINNMKFLKFLMLGLLFVSLSGLTGCKKNDIDPRDQYVGTWQYKEIGSLTLYYAGESIGTVPIDETGTANVSKSGENGLMIDGKLFTVNDNKLSSDPESVTETDNGVNIVGTATYSGQLGSNIITINSSITGTWSNSNGATGNFSGTTVRTLTK